MPQKPPPSKPSQRSGSKKKHSKGSDSDSDMDASGEDSDTEQSNDDEDLKGKDMAHIARELQGEVSTVHVCTVIACIYLSFRFLVL